jgi:hypothetical protein
MNPSIISIHSEDDWHLRSLSPYLLSRVLALLTDGNTVYISPFNTDDAWIFPVFVCPLCHTVVAEWIAVRPHNYYFCLHCDTRWSIQALSGVPHAY